MLKPIDDLDVDLMETGPHCSFIFYD